MPYRKVEFFDGEVYHLILRGIDGKLLFNDLDDYYRGIFSIYEFNDSKPATIRRRREARNRFKKMVTKEGEGQAPVADSRDRLVDVLAFCFMPNHIHLLLKQKQEDGIHKFMVKVGSGYGRYFNQKNKRKGYVFQNRFQSVHIENDNQLRTVINYIHANPISIIESDFKEKGIRQHSAEEVLVFLKTGYRWSSFPDYDGLINFPSVTNRDFVLDFMGGQKGVHDNIMDWILYKRGLAMYEDVLLNLNKQTPDVG